MRWNNNKDDDTITRGELRKALQSWRMTGERPVTFGAYHSLTNLVDEVFREVQGYSSPPIEPELPVRGRDEDNCGEMTVTQSELKAALYRLNYSSEIHVLFADIKAHREPTWKQGDVVVDANRVLWRRTLTGQWQRVGTGGLYGDSALARPLKRMVAES